MILWGEEHERRATSLANAYGETAKSLALLGNGPEGTAAVRCADKTLTVWGHGDANTFAELSNGEFGQLIRNWKKLNTQLKTVEIITCDARHNDDPFSGYASSVAKFVRDTCGEEVVVKALPVGQHKTDCSILWANVGTASFCYITAPSDEALEYANQRLKTLSPGNSRDLNKTAQDMAKEERPAFHNYTVNGGYFKTLRDYLGIVK